MEADVEPHHGGETPVPGGRLADRARVLRTRWHEQPKERFGTHPWGEPRSFDALCDVMAQFIRGAVTYAPAHLGPLDEETYELVEYLVRFCEAGFMTTNSQPTSHEPVLQFAYVEGFAPEDLARRIASIADTGSLGVVLTEPDVAGDRGGYGDDFPYGEGYPSPAWISMLWKPALSPEAYLELRRCWYVVAFDVHDHDPYRLWRNVLGAIEGPPSGVARLFEPSTYR